MLPRECICQFLCQKGTKIKKSNGSFHCMVFCIVHCMVHCVVQCMVLCMVHCMVHCVVHCVVHGMVHCMVNCLVHCIIIRILSDPVGSRTDPGGFPLSFAYFCACIPNGSCRIPSDPARILSVYLFCCTLFYVDPVRILSDPGTFSLSIVCFCAWSLKRSRAPANGFLCFSYAFLKGSRADPSGSCTDPAHFLTKARRNLNNFELHC